jgi:hypothetical protein
LLSLLSWGVVLVLFFVGKRFVRRRHPSQGRDLAASQN